MESHTRLEAQDGISCYWEGRGMRKGEQVGNMPFGGVDARGQFLYGQPDGKCAAFAFALAGGSNCASMGFDNRFGDR